MRFQSGTLLAAALFVALAASPAIARDPQEGGCLACGRNAGVPGPAAGAGLGYLLLAGGYYMVRRWRKQDTGE
jgi:hypothetical protein